MKISKAEREVLRKVQELKQLVGKDDRELAAWVIANCSGCRRASPNMLAFVPGNGMVQIIEPPPQRRNTKKNPKGVKR